MAELNQKTLLQSVAVKSDTGDMGTPVPISATFENVIDTNSKYTLAQFFKAFTDYMTTADFIYYGAERPDNPHIKIWINSTEKNLP